MKPFISKIVLIIALLILIDFAIGSSISRFFDHSAKGGSLLVEQMYRQLEVEKGDLLIFGSSTAAHHYNTDLLRDSLNLTVTNLGVDGRDIVYSDLVCSSVFERQIPQFVIIDVNTSALDGAWLNRNNSTKLFYDKNIEVTRYYDNEVEWGKIKMLSHVFRFNDALHYLIRLNRISRADRNGYSPLYSQGLKELKVDTAFSFKIDATEFEHLEHIYNLCRDNGSILMIVKSPHKEYNEAFNKWLNDYCSARGIRLFLACDDSYWYKHPNLFYDGSHLNSDGARIFTNRILKEIKTIL